MSAGAVLQDAMVAAVREALGGEVTSVFDAPPLRSAMPWALVEEPIVSDWSTKDAAGRECRASILIHDTGERPVRLRMLADRAEAAIGAMPSALGDGWTVAALSLTRRRTVRQRDGHWTALVEHRVAMLRDS